MTDETLHYPDEFINALQAIWGNGFLSPGGPDEIAVMLDGFDLTGMKVLDIGCGIGRIDCLLVEKYGVSRVTAIDVEPQLIDYTKKRVAQHGLGDRINPLLVTPGPLQFDDESFDLVFSKDAMLHIPDKQAIYAEVLRVLKPGGKFIASDWLRGGPEEGPTPDILIEWGKATGLEADFATPNQTRNAMELAGFQSASVRDRNEWYRSEMNKEKDIVLGHGYAKLVDVIGQDAAQNRVDSYTVRRQAVDEGALRPCHLIGHK